MRRCLVAGLAVSVFASMAVAQSTEVDPSASSARSAVNYVDALGDQVGTTVDVEVVTGQTGNLGVVYLDCMYYVSTRVIVGAGRENVVTQFNADGTPTGLVFNQEGSAFTDAWGYRDGFTDGTNIYFGWGGGVNAHAPDGTFLPALSFGGANCQGGNCRALAYNPDGNGGAGSFWTASFGSDLIELDMMGNPFAGSGFASNVFAWSLYGLAWVDNNGTGELYGHHTGGDVILIDTVSSDFVTVFNTAAAFSTFGAQGGFSPVPGGSSLGGTHSGDAMDFVALGQATPDAIATFEYDATTTADPCDMGGCYADCDGSGTLNILDYICFGDDFAAGGTYADCDGSGTLNILDYICFGDAFAAGCP